jgi:monofunctional biosynthetic peptidoglycan transglycosylase
VEERAHDRGQSPPDADAAGQPASHAAEATGDEPTTEPRVQADPGPPVLILPRAAGGGAGAVVVPAVMFAEAALPPAPETAAEPVAPPMDAPLVEAPRLEAPSIEATPVRHAVLTVHEPVIEPPTPEPVAATPEPVTPTPPPAFVRPQLPPVFEPPPARERTEPPPQVERNVSFDGVRPGGFDTTADTDIWRTEPPAARAGREALQPSGAARRLPRITLRGVLMFASVGLAALAGVLLALIMLYRWVDPPASTLILGQRLAGTPITQRWVPLERISPNLISAVVLSEDGAFCRHHGVDWGELREAIESANDGIARGGSTISMQVVKNLFLWPSRNYIRKALEIPLTYVIEAAWSKQRILEIYLNIAEWGPGIFGAEAAARYHFRKSAAALNPREAALLAVSLPNPFDRQAGRPGPGTARLADNLLLRMRSGQGNTACVRARPASG